jgi:hypothetical protein
MQANWCAERLAFRHITQPFGQVMKPSPGCECTVSCMSYLIMSRNETVHGAMSDVISLPKKGAHLVLGAVCSFTLTPIYCRYTSATAILIALQACRVWTTDILLLSVIMTCAMRGCLISFTVEVSDATDRHAPILYFTKISARGSQAAAAYIWLYRSMQQIVAAQVKQGLFHFTRIMNKITFVK